MAVSLQQTDVSFMSQGVLLAGRLHRNTREWSARQPGVVVCGSWLTVKEQMAETYAAALAWQGYTVLSFDFAGFGASGGLPRQLEMPVRKIADIDAACRFLRSLSCVRGGEVGLLGICAGAQYALAAVAGGAPVAVLVSVAGWFHDTPSVAPFYGGDDGVALRLQRAQEATHRLLRGEPPSLVPAYEQGNERAGMFFPLDYYADRARGAVASWRNEMDEASWLHWLSFDGLRAAADVRVPCLFVHSEQAVFPEHVRRIATTVGGLAELCWLEGGQTDFYDLAGPVQQAVQAAQGHFQRYLA